MRRPERISVSKGRRRDRLQAAFFVAPAVGIMAFLMAIPLVSLFVFSLQRLPITRPRPAFAGLANFGFIFGDPEFWRSMANTGILTVASVSAHLVVALFLAVQIDKPIHAFARTVFRIVLITPWIFTAVVVAIVWMLVLSPLGILNYGLRSLGLIDRWIEWLGEPRYAMVWVVLVNIWRGFPYLMISFLAGLQTIPVELTEAAKVDGANDRTIFFRITLPIMSPLIASLGLLDTIWTITLFPLVWLLTSGGPGRATEVLATYTYRFAFVHFDFGKASAAALIMLAFLSIAGSRYMRLLKSRLPD